MLPATRYWYDTLVPIHSIREVGHFGARQQGPIWPKYTSFSVSTVSQGGSKRGLQHLNILVLAQGRPVQGVKSLCPRI